MERDSVLFYRSFYEAISGMPKEVQLEVYTAIMEYGLNGRLPDDLKPIAKGMFALMKPIIDNNNTRFANGKKGGRKSSSKAIVATTNATEQQAPPKETNYSLTFAQEISRMKADADWADSISKDYAISTKEYADRLKRFLKHCNESRKGKPHDSFDDAKSHFRYWMDKAFPTQSPAIGVKSSTKSDAQILKEAEQRRREAEERSVKELKGKSSAEILKQYRERNGLDPGKSIADSLDQSTNTT